jgi:hypothetical protein
MLDDLLQDWKSWSESERASVFVFALGLALVLVAALIA